MNLKTQLLLENLKVLDNVKGTWGNDIQKKSAALTLTMKNQRVDSDRINEAINVIKKNTSIFSTFRGHTKLSTAILIALESDMEEAFNEIKNIYDKLKVEFSSSEYLILAARTIFSARYRVNIDDAVRNTKIAYDCMKDKHKFLTGKEDIPAAAMIATTSKNIENTFIEIEKTYEYFRSERLDTKNNIQSLAHILSLINLDTVEKNKKVLNMSEILKSKKMPMKNYYLSILGIISFLDVDKERFAYKIEELSKELKKERGFGNLSLGRDLRNMIAATLVSLEYINDSNNSISDSLIDNTNNVAITVIIAMEMAMIATMTAVSASVATSASN